MPSADSLNYLAQKAAAANAASNVGSQQNANQLLNEKLAVEPIKFGRQPLGIDYKAVAANEAAKPAAPTARDATSQPASVVGDPYKLESDPVYQSAIQAGQSQFNSARAESLANKNSREMELGNQRRDLDKNSAESRRRLAGNYAARGMAGGATGALTLAEMEANARQITAQTDIKDQISALNANYLQNYGNAAQVGADGKPNFDWTSTLVGQNYKTQAAQNAITAQLARMGIQ